ncbi:TPA: hypothetical protein ACHGKB_004898 [Escherichia coli]
MLGGDTAFDVIAALATCATGDNYCTQAQSDVAKKDAAAANVLNSIMNGDPWKGTSYKMTDKEFKGTWNGNAVFNQ